MKIKIVKVTDGSLLRSACSATTGGGSKATLTQMYRCEHSPIRTQLFWIEMADIPTFVSVHFVRHKVGVEHFVKSNRDDRNGGDTSIDRNSPVTHCMLVNAQALINMARKRLCGKAHYETVAVMDSIKTLMEDVDPELEPFLVPECVYRGGECHEPQPCYQQKH